MNVNFTKGLVPAIVVDDQTNEVLMLAYMNEEAYQRTIETKETWFYSRSRKELWNKGATSGNKQMVVSIQVDCDEDSLLIRVNPNGPACHTGEKSCFYRSIEFADSQPIKRNLNIKKDYVLYELIEEIEERKLKPQENSYTNYLFEKGIDKIAKKVIEEAGEVIIAAKNQNKDEIVSELSDLVYHCLVLLSEQNIPLQEVEKELRKRSIKKGNNKGDRPTIEEW
ncbi:bifunctional phosphoribosyl-AMP cyclohydrolase/phosphoribosyl-ATP diphosphatase HisIE [Heyndrickxia acidicola]|uniref:Histidine biosynthesis bifunctional protein HisIE n=1 Tax=Heyndrickxia acidicola TaxID=209389 RepID=A0ABU6MAD7_9BACI|nr:bifunctional phosphoribosyl-AMP cyclohydrolase/phosphoribosyl-ATP diphosphatase HisIE [Heyndrickxia acidicola]MED1201608.1 bifunctional phosphoribosyl-AMP cyclohydrolase/phosphoribosyl-ATP diphosphatase HisIE [Heyndrickxia acidicola]